MRGGAGLLPPEQQSDPCARGCWFDLAIFRQLLSVGSVCAGVLVRMAASRTARRRRIRVRGGAGAETTTSKEVQQADPCARGCWGGTSLFFEEMLVDLKNRKLDVT